MIEPDRGMLVAMGRPTANQVLEQVQRIGPSIAARSNEIEEARTLPADVVDLIRPTGAFRMYVADDLPTPGVTAWQSLEVLEELAYHDGAAGWCSMIGSTTSLLSAYLPDDYAKDIFGRPDSISGGFAMPVGRATPVDGGLRVTGQWQWGSGTRHSDWVGGGALVVDAEGQPRARSDGLAVPFVFFSADQVDFIDNWHVSGLSGTGSGDYAVTDAFVPEGRWVQMGRDEPARPGRFNRFSFYGLLACGVASCAVGIGRRAIDELVVLAASKKPQGSSRTLRERATIQAEVAEAEARLASAWAFLRHTVDDAWATSVGGEAPSDEQKRLLRLSATHATQAAASVAEMMYKAGGGAAVYKTSPLQRCFRDAFVATQHAMVAPRMLETAGRMRLGLDTDTRQL
jgi:alkylation response protein AidB-like acyl-CoA dehydrogenase